MTVDDLMSQGELYSEDEVADILRGTFLELADSANEIVNGLGRKFVGVDISVNAEIGQIPEVNIQSYGVCSQYSTNKRVS